MFYFIPAWYGKGRKWHFDIVPWYFTSHQLEFDDSIHQLRIFKDKQDLQVLHLSYNPHLRYFLHRQDIYELDVFSVFDDIQQIDDWEPRTLQLTDFDWPADCQFFYNPFIIQVYRGEKQYAQIEMGAEGFISHIRFYKDGAVSKLVILDDRGFVSSAIYYEDGRELYQEYLSPSGIWMIKEDFLDNHVEINPIFAFHFERDRYTSLEDLVQERLGNYLIRVRKEDIFVVASSKHHNDLLSRTLPLKNSLVQTFFDGRNRELERDCIQSLMEKTDLVIVDTQHIRKQLEELFPEKKRVIHQRPSFDTRLQLGSSQSKKESKLYYQINLDEVIDEYALFKILQTVAEDDNLHLVIGMYNGAGWNVEKVQGLVDELIDEYLDRRDFIIKRDKESLEDLLNEGDLGDLSYRFAVQNITSEVALIQELEYTRLIIDLSQEPNLYTQIAGISAGIPQINKIHSDYVEHGANGYILEEVKDLPTAVHYYVDTLKPWNEALIHSINKIKANTGDEILRKWEEWLND